MRDLLDAGAVLALGSDWPVADADPRLGLAAAQLRRLPSQEHAVVPDQAITAHEALAGYTLAPALVAGEDAVAGRIRVGMRADLTGLAVDPVDAPAEDLPDIPVWLTVVAGMSFSPYVLQARPRSSPGDVVDNVNVTALA